MHVDTWSGKGLYHSRWKCRSLQSLFSPCYSEIPRNNHPGSPSESQASSLSLGLLQNLHYHFNRGRICGRIGQYWYLIAVEEYWAAILSGTHLFSFQGGTESVFTELICMAGSFLWNDVLNRGRENIARINDLETSRTSASHFFLRRPLQHANVDCSSPRILRDFLVKDERTLHVNIWADWPLY